MVTRDLFYLAKLKFLRVFEGCTKSKIDMKFGVF